MPKKAPFLPIVSFFIFVHLSCAHSVGETESALNSEQLRHASPSEFTGFQQTIFHSPYYGADHTLRTLEWTLCRAAGAKASFVLFPEDFSTNLKGLCRSQVAQAFLARGYSVIAGSLPAGIQIGKNFTTEALPAYERLLSSFRAKAQQFPEQTLNFWGSGLGASLAGILARRTKDVDGLILGSGVYDFYAADDQSQSKEFKEMLAGIKAESEEAWDNWSLVYDFEKLPKIVHLYHGNTDQIAPVDQAKSFYDSLLSSGFTASWLPVQGASYPMSATVHAGAIARILAR